MPASRLTPALSRAVSTLGASALPCGRTVLDRQYHPVPFHLSKPYWDGRVLLVQPVNPTAGIFQGDRMDSRIAVAERASLLVTSPSAARTHTLRPGHRADDGEPAVLVQRFEVARDSWLEVFPELLIPQTGSSFLQHTEIDVEDGGELYFGEMLSPGRLAHGECLAWERLDWSFTLRQSGEIAAVERASVEPPADCWMLDVPGWRQTYYAAVWMVSPALASLPDDQLAEIEALSDATAHVGVCRIKRYRHRPENSLGVQHPAETNQPGRPEAHGVSPSSASFHHAQTLNLMHLPDGFLDMKTWTAHGFSGQAPAASLSPCAR